MQRNCRGILRLAALMALLGGACAPPAGPPAEPIPLTIDTGSAACALMSDATVSCWGPNGVGQLGNGLNEDSHVPVAVAGLPAATSVSVGGGHGCAVLTDGTVQCWGYNVAGQLGDPAVPLTSWWVPVVVEGLDDVTQIAAGANHNCALIADGSVECWGDNSNGQLGDGTSTSSVAPTTVTGIDDAVAVSAGFVHSCAVHADATMSCWGGDVPHMYASGSQPRTSPTPLAIPGVTDIEAMGTGFHKTCAATDDGAVSCWGMKFRCCAGGAYGFYDDPIEVIEGVTGAVSVGAGIDHACAVTADADVTCWGRDVSEVRGLTAEPFDEDVAAVVLGLPPTRELAVSEGFNCALSTGHEVRCWGSNYGGRLGDPALSESETPLLVAGL